MRGRRRRTPEKDLGVTHVGCLNGTPSPPHLPLPIRHPPRPRLLTLFLSPSQLFASLLGCVAGCLYSIEDVGLRGLRLPPALQRACQSTILPMIEPFEQQQRGESRVGGAGRWLQRRLAQMQGGGGAYSGVPTEDAPRREALISPPRAGREPFGGPAEVDLMAQIQQRMQMRAAMMQSAAAHDEAGGSGSLEGAGGGAVGPGPPPEEVVSVVLAMGFTREHAVCALGMFDNDPDRAVNHLLESGGR